MVRGRLLGHQPLRIEPGDDTRLGPFVAAMVASGSGLVALGVSALRRRRRDDGWGDEPAAGYPPIRRGRVTAEEVIL